MKVGRNEPCPCRSGKKFKNCHGANHTKIPASVLQQLADSYAAEVNRQQQQGFGRPIISTMVGNHRFVAVGGDLCWSPPGKWRTFHDFLLSYIRDRRVLGGAWAEDQLQRPAESRHPLFNWFESTQQLLRSVGAVPGRINVARSTATSAAFLGLAYNLYLIAHNVAVQKRLLARLRRADAFLPAVYETRVAAALIHAGFDLSYEDESDARSKHCEFVATYRATGRQFSVEAKMRQPGKRTTDVGSQLYSALAKPAQYARIVFIELNVPDVMDSDNRPAQIGDVLQHLRSREKTLTIRGEPAPAAYVIITNNPRHYAPEGPLREWALVEGFKIPDYRFEASYSNVREAELAKHRHVEVNALFESFRQHRTIPADF